MALGATDGSLITIQQKKKGAHSFVIGCQAHNDNNITGSAITPASTNMCSLTTELYGLLAFTLMISCIAKHYEMVEEGKSKITVYCDNEQAVDMAETSEPPINISETLVPEYDLKILLQEILQICPIHITYEWIKGHQDEEKETRRKIFGPFPQKVQLNILADSLANTRVKTDTNKEIIRPVYSTTIMGLYNKDGVLIGDIRQHLTNAIYGENLLNYLCKKHKWTKESSWTIQWEALEAAVSSYGPTYRTKICQLMHDWQYIGERKHLMYDKDNKCPTQCGEIESKMHYVWCRDKEVMLKRQKAMGILKKQLQAMQTCPGITMCLTRILNNGFEEQWSENIKDGTDMGDLLYQAYITQKRLGKNSLPKGYLVTNWQQVQVLWQSSTNDKTKVTILQWMKNVIVGLHTFSYSMWKVRNDVLHKDKVKSKKAMKRSRLQTQIASLYGKGRANLTQKEKITLDYQLNKGREKELKICNCG